jgi:hypothetical protein
VQLAVEHEARPGLERVRADAEDAGVVEERRAPPSGVDDDLGAGTRAGLQRTRAEQREAGLRVVEEGVVRTEQGAVEIDVEAAQGNGHGDLVWVERMAVVRDIEPWDELLAAGREDERLVTQTAQNARPARSVAIPEELHPQVADALRARGIERLYSHQADALHAAWAGPTVVTTGTASGKSLCFQLPTLDVLCRDAKARALYLYPAKALAQDQARALNALGVNRVRQAIYDGDTPREQRSAIRRRANVVLTNPDMLHIGILPNHRAWATSLATSRS